ncbi:unnamed protein product [Angiostrongylus costaricensis]|uniref:Borealin domain-containing protein n=1 Tax=Angiostrongylus costaricensis TaxID=334426 RepID=A0A0R3PKJ3_ANGCS|nr:unnamed protein product [Angiostrongylus costaricensis]
MTHKTRQTKSESRKKLERDLVLVREAFNNEVLSFLYVLSQNNYYYFAIDIASEAVSAFERLAIPVDKTSSSNEGLDGQSVRTPLQENNAFANLPSVIRPKVEEVRARKFRSARGGEVAFSVDGSPLVVPPNVTDDLESAAFKQIITDDGEALTPASRDAVSTVKRLVLKKISEVQRSPPQLL